MKLFLSTQAARECLAASARSVARQTLDVMLPRLRPAPLLDRFGWVEAFVGQWAREPRSVGAVCPSGARLARHMAAMLPPGDGLVVELGAGTGAVTGALLVCVPPERLLVLERLPAFCHLLRSRFPDLNVIRGDAARLAEYLPANRPVAAIVSSLPLLSLPAPLQTAIVQQMCAATAHEGCIIQFTYALWGRSPLSRAGCRCEKRDLVLCNLPPAKVERFRNA